MLEFSRVLPAIRRQVERDLSRPGLSREKVLATVVRLLECTGIRVGNNEYARANRSFGLTTLRNHHVEISGSKLRFQFRGKGGKVHDVALTDRRLARIVTHCQAVPGETLFQYVDADNERQTVDSGDVNGYLREITSQEFTAKDFRTWAGTLLAVTELGSSGCSESITEAKSVIARAVEKVAKQLGNTPAICRKCYIHPAVLLAYQDSESFELWEKELAKAEEEEGLGKEESALLKFLEARE
jgi:DNA topoisomerase-1